MLHRLRFYENHLHLLLARLPLFAGVLLLQIPPAATTPTNLTDVLLQGLSQVPVYAILAYIVINIQRTTAKENERRDSHEKTITDALITERKRIDEIEEDRRKQWEDQKTADTERDNKYIESFQAFGDGMNRIADVITLIQKDKVESDRVLSDLTSGVTAIVTVGSKPLQQVVKDVSGIFNRFEKVFPSDKPMDLMIAELQREIIDAINKSCEDRKQSPPSAVTNIINPPDRKSTRLNSSH